MRHVIFIKGGQITTGADKVTRQIEKSRDGSYIWELKKEKSKATSRMMGYLFGYVYPAILEEMGQVATVEALNELDREMKIRFGPAEWKPLFEMRREKTLPSTDAMVKPGKPFMKVRETMLPKSKADYTVQEMQDYWMSLQKITAEMWGRTLKDPDPNWKDGWVKKERPVGDGQGRAKGKSLVK